MTEDGLTKLLEEIKKNPELMLEKYLKAEKLVVREETDKKNGGLSYHVYKDVVVLYTEGMAFFIDEEKKVHQVNPDAIQEIVYSAEASHWLRHMMLYSASQMVNQLMISKKFERPEG
jgi:hypothetical protein